jgi:hypothetical protein
MATSAIVTLRALNTEIPFTYRCVSPLSTYVSQHALPALLPSIDRFRSDTFSTGPTSST